MRSYHQRTTSKLPRTSSGSVWNEEAVHVCPFADVGLCKWKREIETLRCVPHRDVIIHPLFSPAFASSKVNFLLLCRFGVDGCFTTQRQSRFSHYHAHITCMLPSVWHYMLLFPPSTFHGRINHPHALTNTLRPTGAAVIFQHEIR